MTMFATPFLVVNLGCEMIYVVEQRLRAQGVPRDKAGTVLAEVCGVLLHERLLAEVWARAPAAAPGAVRRLLLDVCGASLVRLDDRSADKLWQLATGVLRWQLHLLEPAHAQPARRDVFALTARRLRGVRALLPGGAAGEACSRALRRFRQLAERAEAAERAALLAALRGWLADCRSKVSVLLRLGLQREDGSYAPPERVERGILDALGDNIYTYEAERADTAEISCLLAAVAGPAAPGALPVPDYVELRLPLGLGAAGEPRETLLRLERNTKFESIDTSVRPRGGDLSFSAEQPRSAREDLLALLEREN